MDNHHNKRSTIAAFLVGCVCGAAVQFGVFHRQVDSRFGGLQESIPALSTRLTSAQIGNLMISNTPYWSVRKQSEGVVATDNDGEGELRFGPCIKEPSIDQFYKKIILDRELIHEVISTDIRLFYSLEVSKDMSVLNVLGYIVRGNQHTKFVGFMRNDFVNIKVGFDVIYGIREVV